MKANESPEWSTGRAACQAVGKNSIRIINEVKISCYVFAT